MTLTSGDGTQCAKELIVRDVLQQIAHGAGLNRAQDFAVRRIGCEDDDFRTQPLGENVRGRVDAIHTRHAQVQ